MYALRNAQSSGCRKYGGNNCRRRGAVCQNSWETRIKRRAPQKDGFLDLGMGRCVCRLVNVCAVLSQCLCDLIEMLSHYLVVKS